MKKIEKMIKITILIGCLTTIISSLSAQENALHLDGTSDYIDCGNNPSLNIIGTAITLEAWVYPTSFQPNVWQGNVINKAAAAGGLGDRGYMLRVGDGGQVNFNLGTGSWNELNSPIGAVSLNNWHHIAGTYDGAMMRLYVDGVQVGTQPLASNISSSPNNLLLGDDPAFPSRFFPGRIDEVRIWDVTRSAAEIVEDMNTNTCGTIPANLKAYYRFNQGVTNGNNAGETILNDETGVNNGTLTSFTLTGTFSNWVDGTSLSSSYTSSSVSICQGDSILILSEYRKSSGTFTDSLQTADGCDSLIVTILTVTPPPTSTSQDSICQGDSIFLAGSFRTIAGSYTDSLQTANGCDSLFTTTLTVNQLPLVSIDPFSPNSLCSTSAAVPLPAGSPILGSYSGNGVNGGDFDPLISGLGTHIITYSFTDGNGCSNSDTTSVLVETCVGIVEKNISSKLQIFPNPTKDILTINVNDKDHKQLVMKLVDITGKTIKNIVIPENAQNMRLNFANLNNGLYFLIINTDGTEDTYKVTKF